MRSKCHCLIALILGLACGHQTWGQNEASRSFYGKGVHAYYQGNVSVAREHLDQSIVYSDQDPRAYYFRGLTRLRSGDTGGAETDFSTAANLEYTVNGNYDIGMTLSRIQGADRIQLESVRRATRAAVRSAPKPQPIEPTVPQVAPEPYDEFDQAPPNSDKLDDLPPGEELPADQDDPFADDPIEPEGAGDDPFGASGTPADDTTAGTADGAGVAAAVMRALFNAGGKAIPSPAVNLPLPGGGAPAAPEGAQPGFDTPAADDPFAEDAEVGDAADDPFAVEPTADKPAETPDTDDPFADDPAGDADPFSDAPPAADDDPFAEPSSATEDGPPAAADDDPFADDPGEAPADDDPFGAGGDDPFGDTGDDPFGEPKPSEDAPAAEEDDPFGG